MDLGTMSTTMKLAIQIGLECDRNVFRCHNTNVEGTKTLFDIHLKEISKNTEIATSEDYECSLRKVN